jgi:hypothetical protein
MILPLGFPIAIGAIASFLLSKGMSTDIKCEVLPVSAMAGLLMAGLGEVRALAAVVVVGGVAFATSGSGASVVSGGVTFGMSSFSVGANRIFGTVRLDVDAVSFFLLMGGPIGASDWDSNAFSLLLLLLLLLLLSVMSLQ